MESGELVEQRARDIVGDPLEQRAWRPGDHASSRRGERFGRDARTGRVASGDPRGPAYGDVHEERPRAVPLAGVGAVPPLAAQSGELEPRGAIGHPPWILRAMVDVYLALGANLGDRLASLRGAADRLTRGNALRAASGVYETSPYGVLDQPAFLNACLHVDTRLAPRELLDLAKRIEIDLGRRPGPRWGPRQIDIDLLLYGDEAIDDGDLIVPHPGLVERAFVLVPLAEIAADHAIPGRAMTVAEALRALPRSPRDVVRVPEALLAARRTAP